MAQSIIHTSFAAGELSPNLFGRVDLEKYHVGAALLRNFFVDYRGGATLRPGTQFGARCKSTVSGDKRLIPFAVSTEQTYALEFGNNYIRFISDNALILESAKTITGITQANPAVVSSTAHGYSNGQEVVLEGIVGMTTLNGGNYLVAGATANTFQLQDLDGNPIDSSSYPAYVSGGTAQRVLEISSPYAAADVTNLSYVQSADVLTIVHPDYPPQNLTRTSPTAFSLSPVIIGPVAAAPTGLVGTPTTIGSYNYGYVVTTVSLDGTEESPPCFAVVISSVLLDQTTGKAVKLTWDPPSQTYSAFNIYKWGPIPSTNPSETVYGYIGQTQSLTFSDLNIAPDFTHIPPQFADPFSPGQIEGVSVVNGGGGYSGFLLPLSFSGPGTGAEGFAVVDPATGIIIGAAITKAGKNYSSVTITCGAGGAVFGSTLGPQSGTYPSTVSYIQQRRVYGGPDGEPESLTLSRTGRYDNFDTTPITLATDAIQISLASREVNAVRGMVPAANGLIVLTTGGAVLLSGGGPGQPITPSSVTAASQASTGAANLPPIVVNYDILYVQSKGALVRDLSFNFYVQSYYGNDRSSLANHLFYGHTLIEWAWSEEPHKIIWVVRDDGLLLALTYVPEQEVYAWSRHDTLGLFESVCSISESQVNAVYFIINRLINNQWVQFIERLQLNAFNYVQDAWTVDCGLALGETFPNATLYAGAASGTGVLFTASSAVFSGGDVGKAIWVGGGLAFVTAYISSTEVTCDFQIPIVEVLSNGLPVPFGAGSWSLDTPVTVISGLNHLEGQMVTGLADGVVVTPRVVLNGSITLDQPATRVTIGLGFQAQLQTLYLDVGEPTVQGRRKTLPAVTVRLDKSLGLKVGSTFNTLTQLKDTAVPVSVPNPLFVGDIRVIIGSNWNTPGQLCVQQDFPLPASVLGLIPEVVIGDDGS